MYLTNDVLKQVERILTKGDRVELIPVKNGVRVVKVKRETVKFP